MNCRACGRVVSKEDARDVGGAHFCPACFADLLARKPRPEAARAEPAPRLAVAVAVGPKCQTCGRPLEPGTTRNVRGMTFCLECYGNLMPAPAPPPAPATEEADVPEGPVGPVEAPGMRRLECAGCGRRVAEGGIRRIADEPFCPDCFVRLAEMAGAIEAPPRLDEPPVPPESAAGRCDACLRDLAGTGEATRGFVLCEPCRTSDVDLALSVARQRHRKHLERLARELGLAGTAPGA